MNNNFLAFDIGATSGRAVLGTINDNRLTIREIYRFPNSMVKVGEKHYWDVYQLFIHISEALKTASTIPVKIDSIGVDTWGVDFGCIAEDGSLLGLPRAYRDPYTRGVPDEVFKSVPHDELYDITGVQIMDFNTIFQIFAQNKSGYAPMKYASEILFMPDLLSYMLTGNKVCEYTVASTSGMINQNTNQFDKRLLDKLGIRTSLFGEIIYPGTFIGMLDKKLADDTGLGEIPVIAVAGHDTASAIAAVPASDENFAYLSSGTWSLLGIETRKPIISDKSLAYNFTNEGGIEETVRFLKNITGMWLLEQCRKIWKANGRDYSYTEMEALAKSNLSFSSKVDPDDVRFANPDNMELEIKAALAESGQTIPGNDGEMVSCIFHSLANKYKDVIGLLNDLAPFDINKLHIIGGGSANSLLNQLTADYTGMPVIAGPIEATAIGNIMMQAKFFGIVRDRWEMRRIISRSFDARIYKPYNK